MSYELRGVEWRLILSTKLVVTVTSIDGSKKNNFRSFICGQSSTTTANFVNIGPADVEEAEGLTEIDKIFKK